MSTDAFLADPKESRDERRRPRTVLHFAQTILAATGASGLGFLIVPYAGRAGAALVGAVAVALIGMLRGPLSALFGAVIVFLTYSYFIGERRLPGEFMPGRHLPQLTLFLLAALISGLMASRLRVQIAENQRLARLIEALTEAARRLGDATDPSDAIEALRAADIGAYLRLFIVHDNVLHEISPLPIDDAGRAAEAAEIAWLTGCRLHRMAGIAAVVISGTSGAAAILVASRRGTARVPVMAVEALAHMLRARIFSPARRHSFTS